MVYSGNNCTGKEYYIPYMPKEAKLANAYIPYQSIYEIYSPEDSLRKGTAFPMLYQGYKIGEQ